MGTRSLPLTPSGGTPSEAPIDSMSAISSVISSVVQPPVQSALKRMQYLSAPQGILPENEVDNNSVDRMYLLAHKIVPESPSHFWVLNDGFKYIDNNDNKTTLLLGLTALMEIVSSVINGFKLHLLCKSYILPKLTSPNVDNGFPSSAILVFKYCLVKNKSHRCNNKNPPALSGPSTASPLQYNNEEGIHIVSLSVGGDFCSR
jgi:hypothetical protein